MRAWRTDLCATSPGAAKGVAELPRRGRIGPKASPVSGRKTRKNQGTPMQNIIYLVGLVVIVVAIVSFVL